MPDAPEQVLSAAPSATMILRFVLPWFFLAFAVTAASQSRRRRVVGSLKVRDPGDGRLSRLLLGMIGCGLLLGLLSPNGPDLSVLIFVSLVAAGTVLESPRPGEGVAGEEGLTIGWESWYWPEIKSWRLGGEHLRVDIGAKGGERWLAMRVPASEIEDLKSFLVDRLPDQQSSLS